MYESFFELNRRPFTSAPRIDLYYPGRTIDAARQAIERCVDRAEGAALVMGPAGTGKSLLCQLLVDRFRAQFDVVLLANGRLTTRRALLQAILFELGMPYRGMEEGELRLSLLDRLQGGASTSQGMLLVIDEAHALPLRLLEEVRMITDLVRNGQSRVRLVLSGLSSLEERLATPRLHALQQRITARHYLEPFDLGETKAYVRHQIAVVGGQIGGVFTEAALDSIHRATEGIPRLVNQTCDHALVLACAGGVRPVDAGGIEEAWADLQQLPTPWSRQPGYADPNRVADDGVVEFGSLEEAPLVTSATPTGELLPSVLPVDVERGTDETLDALESHLAELESDFEPDLDLRPEVEIVVGPTRRDPFSEPFVQEEEIVDRYATVERTQMPRATSVYGPESRVFSALLDARRPATTSARLESPHFERGAADERSTVTVAATAVATPPAVAKPSIVRPAPIADVPGRAGAGLEADPVEPDDLIIVPKRPTNDSDMIVIEDDPPAETYGEATPVRKQDFRQMFARLRRDE